MTLEPRRLKPNCYELATFVYSANYYPNISNMHPSIVRTSTSLKKVILISSFNVKNCPHLYMIPRQHFSFLKISFLLKCSFCFCVVEKLAPRNCCTSNHLASLATRELTMLVRVNVVNRKRTTETVGISQ